MEELITAGTIACVTFIICTVLVTAVYIVNSVNKWK